MISEMMERTVFQNLAPRQIHHIQPVKYADAKGLVSDVYQQMERDFQIAPPLTIHSPVPLLLAAVWAATRESLIAGPADRVARETLAAAVSQINICPFCVEVHGMMLDGAGRHDLARAVGQNRPSEMSDPGIRGLFEWAKATRSPGDVILRKPPFSREHAPQFIGTALVFHYINRMVNVFLKESPLPVRSNRLMKRLAGSMVMKRMVSVNVAPGDSLRFLPDVPLPQDLSWAASNRAVAGAFARLAAVIEETGARSLSPEVRSLVQARVQAWRGEEMGLSRAWIENALLGLDIQQHLAARLALLAALASHQLDDGVIQVFRAYQPRDENLVSAVAWASFTAARKIGTWLVISTKENSEP